MKIICDREVNL